MPSEGFKSSEGSLRQNVQPGEVAEHLKIKITVPVLVHPKR